MASRFDQSRLRTARVVSRQSREGLGRAVGRSAMTVRNWENGTRQPSPEMLAAIAAACGCSVSYFFNEQLVDEDPVIAQLVAAMPPLSTRQKERLAMIFAGTDSRAAEQRRAS